MKIWYFEIIEKLDVYIYFIERGIEDCFGETKVIHQFHQPEDHRFYFMGSESDFLALKSILDDPDLETVYEEYEQPYSYKECTQDVLYNIENYLNIENEICDKDILFTFYKNYINRDIVLDKILTLGIHNLSEWDKKVLEGKLLIA